MTGLKAVIYGSAILGGMVAHYGFLTEWNWFQLFRPDMSWMGNVSMYLALGMVVWGFMRKD